MAKQGSGHTASKPKKSASHLSVAKLSPQMIKTMPVRELRRTLPRLSAAVHAREAKRPAWWPHILPWTHGHLIDAVKTAAPSALRSVAKKCCKMLNRRSGKQKQTRKTVLSQPRVLLLDWINSQPTNRTRVQPVKASAKSRPKKPGGLPYLDIYLCHLCNEEFSTKDTLQEHQVQCQEAAFPSTPPVSEAPSPAPVASTPEDSHHSASVASSTATSPDSRSSVPQNQFIAALDLVPFYRARKIRQARRRNTECETIDLEEPQTPVSPSTPRSHKFLITQLSRDPSSSSLGGTGSCGGLASRRSSCLRLSVDKRPDNVGNDKEEEQREESDRESSESSAEDADEPKLRKKTLFSIDVSSMLGQRIIKHMTSEVHVPVISDAEEFCRTPIKDKYQDRLRIRQTTYPVTWKLTRKRQQQFHHLYKFTRADKWDVKETMRTGLNRDSRKLQDSLPKCTVGVKRLSTKTLLKWNPVTQVSAARQQLNQAKPSSHQPSVFPQGPTFLLTDVDRVLGLKRKDVKPELANKLLASHCVSENANAEMQSQKLTVYRCLLTDLYSSVTAEEGQGSGKTGATSKHKEKAPRTQQEYPSLLSILSGSTAEFKHPFQSGTEDASVDVQKPLKIDIPSPATGLLLPGDKCSSLDDSFSVRTVSSDEDIDKNFACCTLCTMRNKCKCMPEKSASAVLDPATSSPAPSLKVPFLTKASLSPPQLDPLSLTPKVSVSSHNSLSPPNLSPVSQVGEGGPQSPSVAHRLSTRRSTLLLRTASSFPKGSSSSSHDPQVGSSQDLSAPLLRCKRGNSATSKQTLSSPTPAKKSCSSPVLSASSNLLQPLVVSDIQRRRTRSSCKQKEADESPNSVLHQALSPKDLECSSESTKFVARQSCTPTNSGAELEPSENLAPPSNSSPSISSSAHADDKNNTNCECVKLRSNPTEKIGHSVKSSSCTGNADTVGSKKEGKGERLNVDVETAEGEKKQAVQDKMQLRGSLRESSIDGSHTSGQREESFEYKKLRSKKCYDAGDATAGADQRMDLTKTSLIKESGKILRSKAEAAGRKDKTSHEDKLTAAGGGGGDNAKGRDTNSDRTLRSRDRKLSKTEINQHTSHCEHSESVSDINKLKALKSADHVSHRDDGEMTSSSPRKTDTKESGIRKLRSSERNNGSAENSEKNVAENILQMELGKNIGLKANGTKAIKVVNKLKNQASEQVQNQDENTETRSDTDGNNMNPRDSRENGTIFSSKTSSKTSKDVLTAFSKAVGNYEESKDKKKSVDRTEGRKLGSRKMEEQDDNANKNTDSFQLNTRKNASSGGSSKTSVHSGEGKEQVAATDQTWVALPRRVSSRKSVADARGEISLHVIPKKKIGRMVKKVFVSSPNGEDAFHPKNDEQKMDTSVGSVETRGAKTKLTSEDFGTQENGFDSGINSAEHVNPFLNSRAQTRLFSYHIKEQIHRTREQKQKMTVPKASKNKLLKSGHTFRMAHISFDTRANAVGEKLKGTETNPLVSLNKWPFTATAASTGSESSLPGAVLSASSPVDTTRMHLSPKQMLSVLESSKRSVPPSKDKAKKEITNISSHGSPARHSTAVTRAHPLSGRGSSVNQKPPSAETMDSSTPVRNAGIHKTPVKSKPDQGACCTNQKTPTTSREFKHQTKVGGERPSPKTRDNQGLKTKVAGKRPSVSGTGKRGRQRKKLCV